MSWIRVVAVRIRALFAGGRLDRELQEELRSHLDMETEANVRRGMSEDEARRTALLAFGNITQTTELYRDRRGIPALETFLQDIRYAARTARKAPAFTAVAIISLALGIGCNTAVFSLLNAVLWRPLPVESSDRLITLSLQQPGDEATAAFSYPDYRDLRQRVGKAFVDILAYRVGLDGLSANGSADRVMVHYVSGNYFSLLGVKPALGRLILPSEAERLNADPILVLGYSYWQARFAGDTNVVGKRVLIDGHPLTIVGVAAPEFRSVQGLIDVQAYLPLGMLLVEGNYPRDVLDARSMRMFSLVGRLRPEVKEAQVRSLLKAVSRQLALQNPTVLTGATIDAQPEALSRLPLGESRRLMTVSALFLALAALVLVLTCVNLTNLLLIRGMARERELAMRAALGASRGRLLRQLLTESLMLGISGAVMGALLGTWTSRAFGTPRVQGIPIHLESPFDWRVFGYTCAATALTVLLLGVLPALRGSKTSFALASRDGGERLSAGGQNLRRALVATQVAGSFVLLTIAGLLLRSLENARRLDFGFDPAQVTTFGLDPHYLGYEGMQGAKFFGDLLRQVRALHQVEAASLGCCGPMSTSPLSASMQIDGYAAPVGQPAPTILFNQVSTGFFETLRIPILRGRSFQEFDDRSGTRVAIINRTMADRYWRGRDPIGQKFQFVGDRRPWMQVVGVVPDGRYLGILDRPQPYFYVPLKQNYGSSEVLFVRSRTDEQTVIAQVRKEIAALAPGLPVIGVGTMQQRLDETGGIGSLRRSALLASALGALGIALAVVGLYGVVSFGVQRRMREIGIRIALGASPLGIRALIVKEGMIAVCVGVATGGVLSVAAAPLVQRFLVGVGAADPMTYAEIAAFLLCVALGASYLPVRFVTRVDPMLILRQE